MKFFAKDQKWKIIIVNTVIFVLLVIFFSRIYPIVLYDKDDWIHIGQMRIPLPMWNGWNPSKVLPEVLMPMCGYIAAYFVYPLIGDYFYSITLTSAVILEILLFILPFFPIYFTAQQ